MDLRRGRRIAILAVASVITASACGGSDHTSETTAATRAAAPSSASSSTTPDSDGPSRSLNDVFASVGITIIEGAPDGTGAGLELLSFQVENLQRELVSGGGYLGAQLDELVGSPDGLPFSYLVAGWLQSAPTPIAESAVGLMESRD